MFFSRVFAAIMVGCTFACGGSDDAPGEPAESANAPDAPAVSAADLPDPCALVTDEQVPVLLWQAIEPGQREGMEARNAQHVITKRVENVDFPLVRTCYFQYRRVAADTTWSEGDFELRTMDMQGFEMFEGARGTHEPIVGVGDQAFYFQNVAYARRGQVGLSTNFGSKDLGSEVLKIAVTRLP